MTSDSIPQQAGPGAGADELHSAIMNLPCNVPKGYAPGKADEVVYRIGHRDARHAAAELVLSHLAAPLAVEDSRVRCASSDATQVVGMLKRAMTDAQVVDGNLRAAIVGYFINHWNEALFAEASVAAMAAASSGKEN